MSATVELIIRVKDAGAKAGLKDTADGVAKVGDAAGKAAPKLSAFERVTNGALERVGHIATDMLGQAASAVVAFVGDSLDAAGDYETSMNVFAAVTEASAEEMEAASETAKQLGADLDLPATSAADAGNAMTELAKAGFDVDEAMAAAKGTLQLAAAAQISEAQAAEIAANALQTFGLAADQAGMVSDLLAASANASSIEVTDAADSYKMAGAVYAAFQGPVVGATGAMVDMTTAIGLLGNAGIKGSDAGTSLKQSLLQLAAPSDKAKGLMRDLAERIGITGDIAYDASGNMRPYREIIDLVGQSTADMTQEQRDYTIATIFGADATRAIISLMQQGPEAWDEMEAAVTRQGAAADLAAAKTDGYKGAIGGFQSQLETLMLEGLEPLLPVLTAGIERGSAFASTFIGRVGPAMEGAISFFQTGAEVAQDLFVPAVGAAGAALVGYAIASIPTALAALPALILKVSTATIAFQANALAVAAAALPYAIIVAAVGGVIYAFQQFNEQISSNTDRLLESRQWWNDSTTAIESYGNASDEARQKLAPYATEVQALRAQIELETEALAKRMALHPNDDYTAEMEHINALSDALVRSTGTYTAQEQALLRQQAATLTSTEHLAALEAGEGALVEQTQLTSQEIEALGEKIQETYQKGAEAVSAYVSTEVAFLDELSQARQEGYDGDLEAQALAYAQEQAAQQAHLGQMLADYTLAQIQLKNITEEQGDQILAAIEQRFGLSQDASGRTFLAMTAQIDEFAASGSGNINALADDLGGLADDAVVTRQRMDELAKEYTAELIHNFDPSRDSAEDLTRELRAIPARVYSEVVINTRRTGDSAPTSGAASGGSVYDGRASGGPVAGGTPYIVGERGPELFVPERSGQIIPNDKISMGGGNTYVLHYYGSAGTSPQADVAQALRMQALLQGA